MASEQNKAIRVGAVMAISMVLFGLFIWVIGQKSKMFTKKVIYHTSFKNVSGLRQGSDVSLAGYPIGLVAEINLPDDITIKNIHVKLKVDSSKANWIRQDSRARIKTMGLLGAKYLEITQGSAEQPALPHDSTIPAVESSSLEDVWERGEDAVDNLIIMTSSLRRIFTRVESGEGLLGQLVSNKEFGEDFIEKTRRITADLESLLGEIESGRGAIGMLVKDRKRGEELVNDLVEFSQALQAAGDAIKNGEGLAGRLLMDKQAGEQIVDDIAAASASLRRIARKLDEGQGAVNRLLTDKEYGDKLLGDLERSAAAAAEITTAIAQGEGTLGKLVQDESIYEGLNDMVTGVNKSRLVKWFLKRSQKKGYKSREKTVLEAGQEAAPK